MIVFRWENEGDITWTKSEDNSIEEWLLRLLSEEPDRVSISFGRTWTCEVKAAPDSLEPYIVRIDGFPVFGKKGGLLINLHGILCEYDDLTTVFAFQGSKKTEVDVLRSLQHG